MGSGSLVLLLAIENDHIRGDTISAGEFPYLSNKYGVMAVPKIIINEEVEFEGALPERHFVKYLFEAVKSGT